MADRSEYGKAKDNEANSRKKILVLAANPKMTPPLRLDEEVREIEEGLARSRYRDRFEFHTKWAVRLRDFRKALLDYEPHIVHFIGHGEEEGILVEDELGNAVRFSGKALSELFKLCASHVGCVVLNACFTAPQASAINKHIDYVIGMKKAFKDKSAIEFSVGFYDALGAGRSIEDAFAFGRAAIMAEFPDLPEYLIPVLKKRKVIIKRCSHSLVRVKVGENENKREIAISKLREAAFSRITNALDNKEGYFFKKYIPSVYQTRDEVENGFSIFLKQIDKRCFIITGRAGKGKTSLLCHLSEKIMLNETESIPILLNSSELNPMEESLKKSISNFFATERMNPSLDEIGDCLCAEDGKLVVIIDAINELEGENSFDLFNAQITEVFDIVKERQYPILFCISCRSEFWTQFNSKKWVKDNVFGPRDGFENTTYELENFKENEIDDIIETYFNWYAMKGEIIGDARLRCCDPIMLRYLCEAFTQRMSNDKKTPPNEIKDVDIGVKTLLQRKEVFRIFARNIRERMFARAKKIMGLKNDKKMLFKITTNYLLHLAKFMMENGRSHFTIEEAYEVARQIGHPDGDFKRYEFYNIDNRSIFYMFIDEGIILDKCGDKNYNFLFESYFEYCLGRYFALHRWVHLTGGENSFQQGIKPEIIKEDFVELLHQHEQLMKWKNFTNLLGSLEYAILVVESNEDFKGYENYPQLFIELIEIMMEKEQFIFRQKAFDVLRETQLFMGYNVKDKEKKLQRVFDIFYKLTKKVDFVIVWDLEPTIAQLSKYEADFVINRMEAWAEGGDRIQPMIATQILARISVANPQKVIKVLIKLSRLENYRKNFWLARSLIFAAKELGMNAKKTNLESEYIKRLRNMLRNLYEDQNIPNFSRGLALSVLPFLSDMDLVFLEKICHYVRQEKYIWSVWNLAYNLREWVKPFDQPYYNSAWIWDILSLILDLNNPHLNYAVYKTTKEFELYNVEKVDEMLERIDTNNFFPEKITSEYDKKQNQLTGIVYSPVFLEPSFNNHIECRERLEGILEKLINVGEKYFNWVYPIKAEPRHLRPVHNEENDRHRDGSKWPGYLDEVKRASEIFVSRSNSINIPVGPSELRYESYNVALVSAGSVISAVDYVMNNPARAAWSMGRPPGHLANNKICILNNIAVGAYHAKKKYNIKRIFIVDCDAHHGKHTYWVFRSDPEVIYFSIHIDGDYAKEEGKICDIGEEQGEGYNFNLPYPLNMGDDCYKEIIDRLLIPVAEEFKPELLMISVGFDGHFEDHLTPGCILSEHAYIHLAEKLRDLAKNLDIKIVGALEGGYGLQSLANSFVHMINVIGEWDIPLEKIGFVPGKEKYDVDIGALGIIRMQIKERVMLMKETKKKNTGYSLFYNMDYWDEILTLPLEEWDNIIKHDAVKDLMKKNEN